jgi:nucleoside-triphosphatase THEP1
MMLFLWTGPKHSGKTTRAARLACAARQCGFSVAGLLAPSIYRAGELIRFDAMDVRSGVRAPLAVRGDGPGDVGPFHFLEQALSLGRRSLDAAAIEGADLAIVDEFGPLELASGGWRAAVDALVHVGRTPLVLVVREELADAARELYADVPRRLIDAAAPESVGEVIQWLKEDGAERGM